MAVTPQQRAALGNHKRALHALGSALDQVIITTRIVTSRECNLIADADLVEVEITQELITGSLEMVSTISSALVADRSPSDTFQKILDMAREL